MKIINLKAFKQNVDCRFMDFYVDVDFAQIFSVYCGKHAKILLNQQKLRPPAPLNRINFNGWG